MTKTTSRRWAVLGCLAVLGGCGDGALCPSDLVVVISSPADGSNVTVDSDPDTEGFQTNVVVRSNFAEGDTFRLTVNDTGDPIMATSDAVGDVHFDNVPLEGGAATLLVVGESNKGCGTASDQVVVNVTGDTGCALAVREGPISNDYYGIPVLNSTNDSDTDTEDFQAHVDITTSAGFEVELFVTDTSEQSQGTVTADSSGDSSFDLTLAQGQKSLRAVCKSQNGSITRDSGTHVVYVDTIVPMCTMTPAAGTTIIPEMDTDDNPDNGTQVALIAHLTDSDVEGESASFTVGELNVLTPDLDAGGDTEVTATFDTPSPPDVAVTFVSQDHAGNPCTITRDYTYVTEGCAISLVSPTDVVTSDSNGIAGDGLQTDLVVQVADACVGKTVTTTCDIHTERTATVPSGGTTTIEVTLCDNAVCDTTIPDQLDCTTSVTSDDGITTSVGASIEADTQPPSVQLQGYDPNPIPCGASVTPSVDIDDNAGNGIQIQVLLVAPETGLTRTIELTNESHPSPLVIAAENAVPVTITLDSGNNALVGVAEDVHGNVANTATCNIQLADIAITVSPPVADGLVGGPDGTVGVGTLTFDICGTVSESGATVELFFDGSTTPQAATVTGTSWCLYGVTLTEGNHTFDVTATSGGHSGSLVDVPLTVDITPPPQPSIVDVTADTRQSAVMQWTATGDVVSYIVKYYDGTLTDGNFDTTGTEISAPSPSGGIEQVTVSQLWAGTAYDFAVASVDSAGNRSTIASQSGVIPDFDASGAILPPDAASATDKGFGYAMARGLFNNDDYYDVAVGAPWQGAVYVFLGSATGLATTPDFTIQGTAANLPGWSLTAIQWDADAGGRDDLVIGAPYANGYAGEVRIFLGGDRFDTGSPATVAISSSDVRITASAATPVPPTATNWFDFGGMGWSLTTARFDGDSRQDLIIGVVNGGSGYGGAAILFGGATATTIKLHSSLDAAGWTTEMGNAVAYYIKYPGAATYSNFGDQVFNLGHTRSAVARDDIAISSIADSSFSNDTAYVYRGRASKPSSGVAELTFNASVDLAIVNPSTDPTTRYAESMGSIAALAGDGSRDIVLSASTQGNGVVWIVDGDLVGTHNVADIAVTTINGSSALWGRALANNAVSSSPDIDNDGIGDLVVLGDNTNPRMYIWFGGSIPTGTTTSATAHHLIDSPAAFGGNPAVGSKGALRVIWAGDLNNDGLEDICWADYWVSNASGNTQGAMEYLFDDGL